MTILDTEGYLNHMFNCAKYTPIRLQNHKGLSAKEFKMILDVYYNVSESYIRFFDENWFDGNLEETNRRVLDDLQKNMSSSLSGNCFASLEQAKEVAEYVLTLQFPADLDSIKSFFNEVLSGRLQFMCCYPIGETKARDLIINLGVPLL